MGFHENATFPDDISYGTRGGPGFDTNIIQLDSGAEERVARIAAPRHRYNAAYGVKTKDQIATLIEFYIARQGPAFGFRFKDFLDYASTTDHRTTSANGDADPAFDDIEIGVGDGAVVDFQLIKKYTNGGVTRTRNIQKPVSGTVLIGLGGVSQSSGFTVNTTTGIVTFSTPPSSGTSVTAGFEFDVPVRFGEELDETLGISIESFNVESVPDIPLVEIIDERASPDEFFMGGSTNHGAITADVNITLAQGRVHVTEQTAASLAVVLPIADDLAEGGPWFYVINAGSTSIEVENTSGTSIITLPSSTPPAVATVLLSVDSLGSKTWYAK